MSVVTDNRKRRFPGVFGRFAAAVRVLRPALSTGLENGSII
jgi:hypothetical protein